MAVSVLPGTYPADMVIDVRLGDCTDCGREILFSEGSWVESADLCRECLDKHLCEAPDWCFACRITSA